MAGDYNATLSAQECWGSHYRLDPLADRLYTLFATNHLVDIFPYPLLPLGVIIGWAKNISGRD